MNEKIIPFEFRDDVPSHLVLSAMVMHCPKDPELRVFNILREVFNEQGKPAQVGVDVKLVINDVPVPFTPVINDVWGRLEHRLNAFILEKAKELISAAGLDKILDAIQQAEWQIELALKERFDKQD